MSEGISGYEFMRREILEGVEKSGIHKSNIEILINSAFRCESAKESVKLIHEWAFSHGLKSVPEGENMMFLKSR